MRGTNLTAKLCDSCKAVPATVFCSADSAFLCVPCDGRVHAANKLASRHARVWICEVCDQAPAAVTCKADAAALCLACDRNIHTANSLARRHERVPIAPFYDAAHAPKSSVAPTQDQEEADAEAASWLLPDPNSKVDDDPGSSEYKSAEYLFNHIDPCLDLDLIAGEPKPTNGGIHERSQYSSDGVVPVQHTGEFGSVQFPGPIVDGYPSYDLEFQGSKPLMYSFGSSQSLSHSVSSSMDVGVVPDQGTMADVSSGAYGKAEGVPMPVSGVDREARVMRYREKRKNRKFQKTIRYASRKAYAETRPRIKGRFAKRSELEVESLNIASAAASFLSFDCHATV